MNKLSVVISAFNEEKKIEDCLKSVSFADEIVVVNNSSTDKTEEIAKRYTKHVYTQPNDVQRIDLQKNFGFNKASYEWILSLDADERIEKELKEEIQKTIKTNTQFAGFWIPRKNYIFGKWIKHTGWYPDNQLRLFKKGSGKFESEHVHEHIKIDGELGHLNNHILHENYDNIAQFIQKTFVYVPNEAKDVLQKGYKFSYFDAIRFPLREFLNRFFAKEGYKDGFYGLMLSLLMAFYHFLVFSYIWELEKYKQIEEKELLEGGKKEIKKAYKEINYWFLNTEINKASSKAKKTLLKVKRKLSS